MLLPIEKTDKTMKTRLVFYQATVIRTFDKCLELQIYVFHLGCHKLNNEIGHQMV